MSTVSTRTHDILDHLYVVVLGLPWVVDYYSGSPDTRYLGAIAAAILVTAFLTSYELGMLKVIPMKVHFMLDVVISLALLLAPAVVPMEHFHGAWPVFLGIGGLVVVLLSRRGKHRPLGRLNVANR